MIRAMALGSRTTRDQIPILMASLLRWRAIRQFLHFRPLSTPDSLSIVTQLARSLDLNSLHALSRTCRQFRANLLQYRKQLVTQTLRCVNEPDTSGQHDAIRENDLYRTWHISGHRGIRLGRIITGKFGACARDMVADCRRCGTTVCRVRALQNLLFMRRHRSVLTTPLELHYETAFRDLSSESPPPSLFGLPCRTIFCLDGSCGCDLRHSSFHSPCVFARTLFLSRSRLPLPNMRSHPLQFRHDLQAYLDLANALQYLPWRSRHRYRRGQRGCQMRAWKQLSRSAGHRNGDRLYGR